MPKITPFLWFDTQAEAAAQFYVSLFPNSKITSVTRYPEGGPHYKFDNAVSFVIPTKDQAETDHYYDSLLEGGVEHACGWVQDRYGLAWQITPNRLMELMTSSDKAKASRVMAAMMTMKKIDIAGLEAAAAAG